MVQKLLMRETTTAPMQNKSMRYNSITWHAMNVHKESLEVGAGAIQEVGDAVATSIWLRPGCGGCGNHGAFSYRNK